MQRDTRRRRPEEPERRATPQRRTKAKRSPLTNSIVYLVVVVAISMVLAAVGWSMANDMLALNKTSTSATITVEDENDFGSVVDQLKTNNIIEHTVLFRLFAAVTGGDDEIAQGTYVVDSDMDYRALLNSLSSSSSNRKEVEVTITEGMTVQQIFQLLEEEGVSTVEKLNDMAANHDYAFSFLQDIPLGDPNRLEGYLFPDTYDFYMGEDARYVINKMLVNFDSRVNDDIRAQIDPHHRFHDREGDRRHRPGKHRLGHLQPFEQHQRRDQRLPADRRHHPVCPAGGGDRQRGGLPDRR